MILASDGEAVAVHLPLARQFLHGRASPENLGRLANDFDDDALKNMVEHAPHDPNVQLGKVTGKLDAAEIKAVVDQVRSTTTDPAAS